MALTVYLPVYFHDAYDKPTDIAGYLGAGFTVIAATHRVIVGFISDRIHFMDGGVLMEGLSLILVIVGSVVMVLFEDFRLNILGTVIIALGIGGCNAATYKILPKFSKVSIAGIRESGHIYIM